MKKYQVFYAILNAKDFGVPQNRERIYIVGFDKQQVSNSQSFKFPEPLGIQTCLGNILKKSVNDKYIISDAL
ncbi:DNA cytosine methyltransferase [Mycoplasmopsis pullorum]|uniref:DNA cytosine methyltransferase n=1 Tax=Mycoplasmopsis pullorum TaxID=48003 RepID=UPI002286AAAD